MQTLRYSSSPWLCTVIALRGAQSTRTADSIRRVTT